MAKWLVIGVDSVSGKGRSAEIDAVSAKGAQLLANDMGIMVERVDPASAGPFVDKSKQQQQPSTIRDAERDHRLLYEPTRPAPMKKNNALGSFFSFNTPFSKEKRLKKQQEYLDRGVNTISEIAFGVFWGMFIFTISLPLVVLVFLAFWMIIGQGLSQFN